MPHICQFLGVNSVTNIELNKGFMPAPIVRNVYRFENFSGGGCPESRSIAQVSLLV